MRWIETRHQFEIEQESNWTTWHTDSSVDFGSRLAAVRSNHYDDEPKRNQIVRTKGVWRSWRGRLSALVRTSKLKFKFMGQRPFLGSSSSSSSFSCRLVPVSVRRTPTAFVREREIVGAFAVSSCRPMLVLQHLFDANCQHTHTHTFSLSLSLLPFSLVPLVRRGEWQTRPSHSSSQADQPLGSPINNIRNSSFWKLRQNQMNSHLVRIEMLAQLETASFHSNSI